VRRLRQPGGPGAADLFAVLGLPAEPGLTDDDVRAAWRRIATATHPDRADGGDPARFAEAAAAYTVLRTRFGRGEALADLADAARPHPAGPRVRLRRSRSAAPNERWLAARRLWSRACRGRPLRLALRACLAAAACAASAVAVGAHPATPAIIVGAVTWLVLTARHDLAPPS
jgi:curved DNA-binding protein CbpA